MPDIISEYQQWKQQGQHLRLQAKNAMEARFRELLTEAIHLCEEYRADFGGTLKAPPNVTAFRYKSQKGKAKPAAKGKATIPEPAAAPKPAPTAAKPDPKVVAIEKKLVTARKKLDAAKAAGTPAKNLEDRIYELEDDLRLALAK
jgi:hypothetical protein